MKRYAVAIITFFDNELSLEVVEANGWKEALREVYGYDITYLPDDIEEAQIEASDSDWMFNVKEIK